jgi:CRP-like cAMP-binding protein
MDGQRLYCYGLPVTRKFKQRKAKRRAQAMATMRSSDQPRRRASPAKSSVRNSILAALLASEYERLLPKLEHLKLQRGETVYRADQKIEHVYFPEEAVIAMIDTMDDGGTVEVGIIGREGIVGINIFLGGIVTPDKAIVQIAGGAMRMKARDLRKELSFGSPLQQLLLAYARTFLAVISQSVACSQHHHIGQRLARLLLTMSDYTGSSEFLMVQESIASLLGVRREGVTECARKLRAAALISYRRGVIRILHRRRLVNESCECYRFIRQQYTRLHKGLPRLLS